MEFNTEDNELTSEDSKDSKFYTNGKEYWSNIPPTVNGMMGGFGNISHSDINGSENFLQCVFKLKNAPNRSRALDCGSGIGRITKNLLIKYFEVVDLVDQNEEFITKAKDFVNSKRVGDLYSCGLQDFRPHHSYDVIWIQWVLGHLTDSHFIDFMNNCKIALRGNGLIIIKENVTSSKELELDLNDSSYTRSESHLVDLLERAGLKIVFQKDQKNFPKGLYPVKMFALVPFALEDGI